MRECALSYLAATVPSCTSPHTHGVRVVAREPFAHTTHWQHAATVFDFVSIQMKQ
jgi:hypothetical protein